VKLSKKPFDLQRMLQQRQTMQDRYLSGPANGGEQVKLLDFMDAQASWTDPVCQGAGIARRHAGCTQNTLIKLVIELTGS
jgi:hypothetical protein